MPSNTHRSDNIFKASLFSFVVIYVGLILFLIFAHSSHISIRSLVDTLASEEIRYSITLTFLTCTVSAILSLFFAVPIGFALSRFHFRGKNLLNTILDVPIILPPIVVGLSLLILFNAFPSQESSLETWLSKHGLAVTFHVPAIILAQFTIGAAFAIRSMKHSFDQISDRPEKVALTLGCNQFQAFWKIALPQAGNGTLTAGLLAWARSLGEFGPILIFAGATRGHTEVLATSIFLELNIGNLSGAAAISLVLITIAILTIALIRFLGECK